jgi:hypothetical protein
MSYEKALRFGESLWSPTDSSGQAIPLGDVAREVRAQRAAGMAKAAVVIDENSGTYIFPQKY